jgi:Ca2+-binding EF-hand superfamily protein
MMTRSLGVACMLLLAGGAAADERTAYADRRAEQDRTTFQLIDRDGAGRVSGAGAAGFVDFSARFNNMDINRDGWVTREELDAYHQRLRRSLGVNTG